MKKLIFILFAGLAMQGCKKQCEGHFMDFDNTTHNVMYVMVSEQNNNRYDLWATIPPAGSEIVEFPKGNTTYTIAFISKGYAEKKHNVYVPACETTYYHASVR